MTREIKVKVWDTHIEKFIEHRQKDKVIKRCFFFNTRNEMMLHDQNGQFKFILSTGIRGENDKEIYEGDIIRVEKFLVETIRPFVAIVEWDKARFALNEQGRLNISDYPFVTPHGVFGPFNTLSSFGQSLHVIGNIYENPELLEERS